MALPVNAPPDRGQWIISGLAFLCFALCTSVSYAHWANFQYRTFDLAYYVQALWQLIHGRFEVSVEHVPLLGNHVEPIVFLFTPFFALVQHPMVFVAIQNAALATMGPVAYHIGKRLGFSKGGAILLAIALLLTPATGFVALHEFHPEALTAPFLLLLLQARLAGRLKQHWLWFFAVLACKENMALLLATYGAVMACVERKRPWVELRRWYLWPMGLAITWFFLCTLVITPAFNSGNIDYASLYDHLGDSPRNILFNAMTQPYRFLHAIGNALRHGNLVLALLLPFLCLPFLKIRWLLISTPILLQHLLSWRSSEWTIYFHYAAPLLPLFWMAAAEGIVSLAVWTKSPALTYRLPFVVLVACVAAQMLLGPNYNMSSPFASERSRNNALLSQIPRNASIVAPLPYLSHLAMREHLYSLHYIIKGLKTLSRTNYEPPPPTDFVLIDYQDSATFDASSGYYHPKMRTIDGRVIPSSDQLLHNFLRQASWIPQSEDNLTLLHRGETPRDIAGVTSTVATELSPHTKLLSITKNSDTLSADQPLLLKFIWQFEGARDVIPWLELVATPSTGGGGRFSVTRGLCAPQAGPGYYTEIWTVSFQDTISPGDYTLAAAFYDNSNRAWSSVPSHGGFSSELPGSPLALGEITMLPRQANSAP